MTRWRRLVRDYEQHIDVSTAMIHVAMERLLWRQSFTEPFSNRFFRITQRSEAKCTKLQVNKMRAARHVESRGKSFMRLSKANAGFDAEQCKLNH